MMLFESKIVLKNIYKTYHHKRVLDIDETIIPLQGMVVIVGWSGSGKSTLLNILSLIDHPDVGMLGVTPRIEFHLSEYQYNVSYRGSSIRPHVERIAPSGMAEVLDERKFRRHVFGFIFQEHYLHPNLNLNYNIKTPLFARQRTISEKKMIDACNVLDITEYLRHFSGKVSGGQAQRAAILRGLLKNSPVLFGDEITSNIDQICSESILQEISSSIKDEENNLEAFLWVSHDIHLVKDYADYIVTIKSGKIDITEQKFESFDAIMAYLKAEDAKEDKLLAGGRAGVFRFDSKRANWKELLKYYFLYAYNDLFKNSFRPTVDFMVAVLSLSFVILFLFSIIKISYSSHKYLELKLSDPRINFLEVRSNEKIEELNLIHLEQLKKALGDSVRFIAPVYYSTVFIKDLDRNMFRSNSNAITFRKEDPILLEVAGHSPEPFITGKNEFQGIILSRERAQSFGYGKDADLVTVSFNNFNIEKGDKQIPVYLTDSNLPFNKTMMIREEFYIDNYKKNLDEELPPIAFIKIYPKDIYDTIKIKDISERMGCFELIDAFKVKNKIGVLNEIKNQTRLFVWLSIIAVALMSSFFVGITIYRSLHKKRREIGVFLAYGMRKQSFQIFYLCESVIIFFSTLVITMSIYHSIIEQLINKMVVQGNILKIVGSVESYGVINEKLLQVPMSWFFCIYGITYLLLAMLFIFFVFHFTSQKPIKLIRDY